MGDDQFPRCDVTAVDTRWTVVRGSDLEEGESQGLPVWSRHVGDPILKSNVTRRVDFPCSWWRPSRTRSSSTRPRRLSVARRPRRSRTRPASETFGERARPTRTLYPCEFHSLFKVKSLEGAFAIARGGPLSRSRNAHRVFSPNPRYTVSGRVPSSLSHRPAGDSSFGACLPVGSGTHAGWSSRP